MKIIVTSNEDLASQTIKKQLIREYQFEKDGSFEGNDSFVYKDKVRLITIEDRLIDADYLSKHFDPELFIFASRHKAKSEMPSLLVHSTGNWTSDNSFGGKPKSISISCPEAIKIGYLELLKQKVQLNLSIFDVTMEVTHHGPTELDHPLIFIELGSSQQYWTHEQGALAVARAVMKVVNEDKKFTNAIGFGGTHYCSNFNKLLENNPKIAIGHVIPKYVINEVEPELILKAIKKSNAIFGIIDQKGTNSAQRQKIQNMFEKNGIKLKKIKDVRLL
ncbi:MAG: D-aminoacyl-tRNA deacylase [Candidatus Helarchaeota archaeon]